MLLRKSIRPRNLLYNVNLTPCHSGAIHVVEEEEVLLAVVEAVEVLVAVEVSHLRALLIQQPL